MKYIHQKIINFLLLFFFLIPFSSAHAGTLLEDIELNLSIETQDVETDFKDDKEVIEKDREVIYALEVKNNGTQTMSDLKVFMESPNYMEYKTGSTRLKNGSEVSFLDLKDTENQSPLSFGQLLDPIPPGETLRFEMKYKVKVPDSVLGDPLYTVGLASLVGLRSELPLMSGAVNTIISGSPTGSLNVAVDAFPPEGKPVFLGSTIDYNYTLTNAGGSTLEKINLTTFIPEGTHCLENCGLIVFSEPLKSGKSFKIQMKVQVDGINENLKQIKNIGFDVSTKTLKLLEVRSPIIHPLNVEVEIGTGIFTLLTEQIPNLILNSPNGKPRPDQGDKTETQYVLKYTGRGKHNTYTLSGGYGIQDTGDNKYQGYCSDYTYPHGKSSSVYAYNSTGGGCENMSQCALQSNSLKFLISTTFPSKKPRLILKNGAQSKSEIYAYGDTNSVNHFMKAGGIIKAPENFTLSRAVEDGILGKVSSLAEGQTITEDLWTYTYAGYEKEYDHCSCGDDCEHVDEYPVYTWQKTSSLPVELKDDDQTNISVYSSTAWLKTEGGHLGTNGSIFNGDTQSNQVNLTFAGDDYMEKNEYVHDPDYISTPSRLYTPMNQTNTDYMLFSSVDNDGFVSRSGEAWQVEGTRFDDLQRGQAYDRSFNSRNFAEDLLQREKYGPVLKDQLSKNLTGTVDIKDNVVWYQTGDLVIGKKDIEDNVILKGGQARLYVEGDVYINANVFYENVQSEHHNDITSLRIDARNIFIAGEVEDLELLLLARENFYSGESHRQLRILGDVIAKNVHWQRKPLLKLEPDAINKPSEHIIEDMRKYVVPAPGDTELPDEYDLWKQF